MDNNNDTTRNIIEAYNGMYIDDPEDQLDEAKFGDLDEYEIKKKIMELTKDGVHKMDEIVVAVGRHATLTGNEELRKHSKALFAAGRAMKSIIKGIR